MPQCMHEGHKAESDAFEKNNGKMSFSTILKGWNPVYRRFEICDPGFIPPRKVGKKKELRHAQAD